METFKKRRKREKEYPRITYDAATRTFDRLFKEDSLEGMKEVVRKKLDVSTSIPVHLSQVRDGKSVDLEDDEDFEAFRSYARHAPTVQLKVVLGSKPTAAQTESYTGSETTSPSKKKRRRKSDASSALAPVASTVESAPPPQKKRRVSFVESSSKGPSETETSVPQLLGTKHKADDSSIHLKKTPSSEGVEIDESDEKKKKKGKQKEVPASDKSAQAGIAKRVDGPTGSSSSKGPEKRSWSQDQLAAEASSPAASHLPAEMEDNLPSRPVKKLKKKHTDIVEEPKKSRATSVPPPPTVKPSLLELRAKLPVKEKKSQTKKLMIRTASEPPSAPDPGPVAPELAAPQEEAPQVKPKRKQTKAKEDLTVDAGPSGKPSKTATATSKDASSIKGRKQKDPSTSSSTEITKKLSEKRSRDQASPAAETVTETPSWVLEAKTPMGKKSEAAGDETAQNSDNNALDSADLEDLRAATAAAVQAVLTRKGIATSGPEAAAPNPVVTPVANKAAIKSRPTAGPKAHPPPTVQENEDRQTPDACPICDKSPNHDPSTCPVIKGGVRTMRKRVAELEKITSEEREEEQNQVLADLQERIRKRARKPRMSNGVPPVDNPTSTTGQHTEDTPASLSKATKSAKQVDVVSPRAPVVNVVPPATSSQPTAAKPQLKRPSSSLLPPTSLKPLSSSQKQSKTSAEPKKPTTEKLMDAFPNAANTNLQNLADLSRFPDLSRLTDNELLNIISGPKLSIQDVLSSDEDEEEELEREEAFLDEEEEEMKKKASRRLGQNISHAEYPSSSDAAGEESESAQASSSKPDIPSPPSSTMLEGEHDGGPLSEEPLSGLGDKATSSGDTNNQGSPADLDKAGNNAVDAQDDAQAQHPAPLSPVPASSLKQKAPEADSDTVVASQTSEVLMKTKSTKVAKVNGVLPAADPSHEPIEPCEDGHDSDEVPESIVSDGGNLQVQSTPRVELVIRTRSQRSRESGKSPGTQEDREISEPKSAKRTKKITELPVPPNPSVRVIKAANNRTRGQKALKEGKGGVGEEEEESSPLVLRTKNTKATPKAAEKGVKTSVKPISRVSSSKAAKELVDAVNKGTGADKISATPKPKPKAAAKITPGPVRRSPPGDGKASSQWTVLQESNLSLMETPGQFDELFSDSGTIVSRSQHTETSGTKAMINGSAPQEPLFLPATQQTSPGGVSLGSQQTDGGQEPSPHDSEDENEVAASVIKNKMAQRTKFRGLSQIVQNFPTPKFEPAKVSKVKEAVRDSYESDEESEESDSDVSESGQVLSHIPTARRAGSKKKG